MFGRHHPHPTQPLPWPERHSASIATSTTPVQVPMVSKVASTIPPSNRVANSTAPASAHRGSHVTEEEETSPVASQAAKPLPNQNAKSVSNHVATPAERPVAASPEGDKKPAARPSAVSPTHANLEDPPAMDRNQTTIKQFFAVASITRPRVQSVTTPGTVLPSHAKYKEICNTLGSWGDYPHIPGTTWLGAFKVWVSIVAEVDEKGFLPDFESCEASKQFAYRPDQREVTLRQRAMSVSSARAAIGYPNFPNHKKLTGTLATLKDLSPRQKQFLDMCKEYLELKHQPACAVHSDSPFGLNPRLGTESRTDVHSRMSRTSLPMTLRHHPEALAQPYRTPMAISYNQGTEHEQHVETPLQQVQRFDLGW
jgi:hypothetical protein